MGYEIHLDESNVAIAAEHLDHAYAAMVELNKLDHLKRGGSYTGGEQTGRWFSWMDPNYPETCSTAKEILQMVGFDCVERENGDLYLEYYSSKTGQEELFLYTIAPFVKIDQSYADVSPADGKPMVPFLSWSGEDGEFWMHEFLNGKLYSKHGRRAYGLSQEVDVMVDF